MSLIASQQNLQYNVIMSMGPTTKDSLKKSRHRFFSPFVTFNRLLRANCDINGSTLTNFSCLYRAKKTSALVADYIRTEIYENVMKYCPQAKTMPKSAEMERRTGQRVSYRKLKLASNISIWFIYGFILLCAGLTALINLSNSLLLKLQYNCLCLCERVKIDRLQFNSTLQYNRPHTLLAISNIWR